MIGQALSFPRSGDDWIPTLLIGGVLTVLGVLVIPVFLVQGYFVRVLRGFAKGLGRTGGSSSAVASTV